MSAREPVAGESLRGYCLRVLPIGSPLRALRDALRLGDRQLIAEEDIKPLSRLLEVEREWADEHFVGHSRAVPNRWRVGKSPALCGHVHGDQARVCVKCLQARGVALLLWELLPVTACPVHLLELQNECPHCARPLRWNRPALTICGCGRDITVAAPKRASVAAVDFAARVANAIRTEVAPPRDFGLLPRFMDGLSAPVQCSIVQAFGSLTSRYQAARPNESIRRRDMSYWETTLRRAADRLSRLEAGENVSSEVNNSILLAQARIETRPEQRRVCLQLIADEGAQYVAFSRQSKLDLEPL